MYCRFDRGPQLGAKLGSEKRRPIALTIRKVIRFMRGDRHRYLKLSFNKIYSCQGNFKG
jgi:hypothetical protein